MSQWSMPSGSIPTKRECGVPTCQCSEYVRGPPSHIFPHTLPIFITGLLVMNVVFFPPFLSFIAGLLEMNTIFIFLCSLLVYRK
jgi:hypothetical protein